MPWRLALALWLLLALSSSVLPSVLSAEETAGPLPPAAATALDAYIAGPEPEFAWELATNHQSAEGKVFHLRLTSQRWQDILWQHSLMVYEPPEVIYDDHMLLFVTGGSTTRQPGASDIAMGMAMARSCAARVAVLHQVPNQPLMGGRVEDDLITETWLKYLGSGDATWPLLFPMVKSAVKAMDALEQFARERGWPQPSGFVISGASKRGWTSWLTAAADARIKATAPMVIDMLNFPEQIRHQYRLWGKPSEQVFDYTSKGLIREDGTPRPGLETQLWEMMDPFSYRQRIGVPKLLIVGANDRYWSTDAMNLYWDDLTGDKYIFRGANAGHGLEGSRDQAITTLGVFVRHIAAGQRLPELSWEPRIDDGMLGVAVQSNREPIDSRFWVAHSANKDFRDSQWESRPLQLNDEGQWIGEEPLRDGGHVAVFAELLFEFDGLPYALATLAYLR